MDTHDQQQPETPSPDITAETADAALELIQKLTQENNTLKDQLLRAAAETDNVRKRVEREKTDAVKYALTGFARDLLSVCDNFARALSAAPASEDQAVQGFTTGVSMTSAELDKILTKHGITKIGLPGEPFDHNKHQAISQVPLTEGAAAGTIASVLQDGYLLHDRLLRPAMVTLYAATSVDTAA